ncbi:MAG: hypothetical protein Q7U02_12030 [Desulfosalsimonadaceae bacterium]|nr:hypothetical protein [Desulfosalsimonadaceae bacterium]
MENNAGMSIARNLKSLTKSAILFPVIVVTFCSLLLVHCSDKNPDAPSVNAVHPALWTDPTRKGTTQYHGTYVETSGTDSCKTCHGSSLQGTADISGCSTVCHFGPGGETSPPGSDWPHGSSPHSGLSTQEQVCNKCHTVMRQYNLGPAACHDCHGQGINHPLGQPWLDPKSSQFHGKSGLNCASCHDPAKDCLQCHFGSSGSKAPAGSTWVHGNNEGHKTFEADQAVCTECHNLDRSYGNPPADCHDCHEIIANHPLGQPWLDPKSSQFHGESSLNCASCHDPAKDCLKCHFGSTGSMAPAGSNWVHGNNEGHKTFEADQAVCTECHNLDRSYGNPPSACHDCHAIIADHPLGQPWMDSKNAQFHGKSNSDCASCHTLSTDCSQCHFGAAGSKVPPNSDWKHGYNDAHQTFSFYQDVCDKCHDVNRLYGNPPSACHDCHGNGLKHPLGQAWIDPKSTQFHGESDLSCAGCHDPATDCTQCHFGASGSKVPAGSNWSHGYNDEHKTFEGFQGICNKCHDVDRSFGNPPSACHDCHEIIANHPLAQTWLDPKSATFHGGSGLNCASCHNLSTNCSQCHFGSTGRKAPAGSTWSHGNNTQHKTFEANQAVCNQCHSLNRSYGNPPSDCHDCHEIVANHPLAQPWLDPKSSRFHGNSSLTCSSCHNLSTDCSECHFGSTGRKAPVGSTWSHGDNDQHKTFEANQAVCNKCHSLNRSYDNPPADCHDCHDIVNHPLGKTWLDPKSSQFHGDSSSNCSSCHNLSKDCSECHFGSGGSKAPPGSGWNHGNNDRHEDFEDDQAVCNKCHNLNRSYGNDPSSCHDCHGDGDGD